ncbi:hypothetical protein AURDEDRAFT_124352 [Auricularia subglabra TFB-10046 SS5]|nr:hypothetical protein AURDEDRAFT_124352 [Auricularia subglabra TFB-10046 SS5]
MAHTHRRCDFLRLLGLGLVIIFSFCIASLSRSRDVHTFPFSTPACDRVLIYRFDNKNGFGSEFNIYLRAAALSSYLNYAVVPDARDWIYGDLREFFQPPRLGCALPPEALDGWAVPVGAPGWGLFRRVALSRWLRRHALLDRLVRRASVDVRAMGSLRAREAQYALDGARRLLPYGESVPPGVRRAFRDQVDAAERIWRPAARVQDGVDSVRDRLGLRTGRRQRPVIVCVRLGDKEREQKDIREAGSHIAFGDMQVYFDAAQEAAARLYDPVLATHPFPAPVDNATRPLLVVMTAEAGVLEAISALDVRGAFEIVASPVDHLFSPSERAEYGRLFSAPSSNGSSWRQENLADASQDLRLAITRSLIVELTVYSRHADAFVVSGNSNLGRLALVLSGEEGALGPPGLREFGGRVRSLDVPYYPTAFRKYSFPQ